MGGVAIMVVSDLVGSTALLARLGDDRMEPIRRAHIGDVGDVVAGAGGRVIKTLGDGALASFDSALGALRAAAAIQAAVERLDAQCDGIGIKARVGVAAGEPIPDGDDLHGMAVVLASRLCAAAGAGEVLVQDVVQSLVASRVGVSLVEPRSYTLKGVPGRVRAFRLLWRELVLGGPADGGVETESFGEGSARQLSGDALLAQGIVASPSDDVRLPPILAAFAGEQLIGRDREIGVLREATAPHAGRRAVLVLGEPGIGKTLHAAVAAAEAHRRGAVVVLARCPPEPVIAFEPWVRAIGELALAGDDAWRAMLAKAAGPELAALVPELGEHAALNERAIAGEMALAEGARYRLMCGIGAALTCAAGEAQLLVVLDDAHWCDPASAQALGHLLDSPPEQLVVVVAARIHEMGRKHPVSRVLSDLRRTGDLIELFLSGLDVDELAVLVGDQVGRAITPGLAARLQARTSGNPFFAGELARDLDQRGALRDAEALDEAPVPKAIIDLVQERLARVHSNTERLLGAAAAIGPAAPVALAARATGLDRASAKRAVQEARSERLVEELAAAQPTVVFPHALIREAVLAVTPNAARARLHFAIAQALEEVPGAEPAELARHYGLSVEVAGPETAIVAYRAAAAAAAERHDHEQAAAHVRRLLALLPETDPSARAAALLELGEQELLAADLVRARQAFRGAIEVARTTGDSSTLARAALGFAGGDIGFGYEMNTNDPATAVLLQEGLDALGEREPRLALQIIFRLAYLLVFSDDDAALVELARRAEELGKRLGDPEARVLARFTELSTQFARYPDPPGILGSPSILNFFEEFRSLLDLAAGCERQDLMFRIVQWSAVAYYTAARIPECDKAIERAGEIAGRLGSPRFSWEVDLNRGMRLMDRGDRTSAEALIRRAGAVVRRLRPDIQFVMELGLVMLAEWIYDGETATSRIAYEAREAVGPRGLTSTLASFAAANDGYLKEAQERMWALLSDGLEPLRRPDGHVPAALCILAYTATLVGDREAGARLRPLLETMRPYLVVPAPMVGFGLLPEWHIGRLELLANRPAAAVDELGRAVAKADALGIVLMGAWVRVDLARALRHCKEDERALAALAEGESMARRYGLGWVTKCAKEARAEIEGHKPATRELSVERSRPIRALATRGRRRALAAMARRLDDGELERRFAEPRRQRALMKAIARSFQHDKAGGFNGLIAYELEPYSIVPPPDAPWRWALEVDSRAGQARLLEPAPLEAAVTIHFGLADWVRVVAGTDDALTAMVAGRCSVEGDIALAVRLGAMFGAR